MKNKPLIIFIVLLFIAGLYAIAWFVLVYNPVPANTPHFVLPAFVNTNALFKKLALYVVILLLICTLVFELLKRKPVHETGERAKSKNV